MLDRNLQQERMTLVFGKVDKSRRLQEPLNHVGKIQWLLTV